MAPERDGGKDKLVLVDSGVYASEKIVRCFPHNSDLYQNDSAGFSESSTFLVKR